MAIIGHSSAFGCESWSGAKNACPSDLFIGDPHTPTSIWHRLPPEKDVVVANLMGGGDDVIIMTCYDFKGRRIDITRPPPQTAWFVVIHVS